jgi:hypothetical protein
MRRPRTHLSGRAASSGPPRAFSVMLAGAAARIAREGGVVGERSGEATKRPDRRAKGGPAPPSESPSSIDHHITIRWPLALVLLRPGLASKGPPRQHQK